MPKKEQFTINLDALQLRLNHTEISSLDLTNLLPTSAQYIYHRGKTTLTQLPDDKKSKYYYLSYSVAVADTIIGTIDVKPVQAKFAGDLVLLRVANELLYSTSYLDLIRSFMDDFNLKINNYSRLDIAIDTNINMMKRFEKYFFNEKDYHFHRNKKQICEVNMFSNVKRNGIANNTVYLAKNRNGKSLTLYDKKTEIETSSHKDYITAYHASNNLDVDKTIWRLELSITNSAIKTYKKEYRLKTDYDTVINYYQYSKLSQQDKALYLADGECLLDEPIFSLLQDSNHLLSIFKRYSENLAEFRLKDDSNITRCTRKPLIELGENIALMVTNKYSVTKNKHEINTMKHNIKFQFEQFQKHLNINYLTNAQMIATDNNLTEYYDKLQSQYKDVINAYNHRPSNYNSNTLSLF